MYLIYPNVMPFIQLDNVPREHFFINWRCHFPHLTICGKMCVQHEHVNNLFAYISHNYIIQYSDWLLNVSE